MNKNIFLIFFLLFPPHESRAESTNKDISTLNKYKEYAISHQNPTEEKSIKTLGMLLLQTSAKYGEFNGSDTSQDVYSITLDSITSNKSYTSYYQSIINSETEKIINKQIGDSRERGYAFMILELISTPEAINILGGLLDDARNPWADVPPNEGDDGGRFLPSDQYAAICLTRSKLRSKPKMTDSGCRYKEDRDAWREWFKQVKSGQRTFSFEGQNVCYRFLPDGSYETLPLSKSIGEDKPIQSRRLPKMDTRKLQTPLTSSVTVHQASPFPWSTIAWLVGGFGLLTIGGGFLWARRNLK